MRSLTPLLAALTLATTPYFASVASAADTPPQEVKAAHLNEDDHELVVDMCHRIAYTVQATQHVTPRVTDAAAKDLLAVIQKDAEAMHREVTELMKNKGIATPMLTKDYRDDLADIAKADKDETFESYRDHQLDVTDEIADALENAAEDAKDADLKAFATKWHPSVRHHREILKEYKPVQ